MWRKYGGILLRLWSRPRSPHAGETAGMNRGYDRWGRHCTEPCNAMECTGPIRSFRER